MRSNNNCEIDMERGVRSGLRIELVDDKVETFVKDSDDVSYRLCTTLKRYKPWQKFYLALAAKNQADTYAKPLITDVDINFMQVAAINPTEPPDDDEISNERDMFLLARHTSRN